MRRLDLDALTGEHLQTTSGAVERIPLRHARSVVRFRRSL
jgi:hypothetical protein